jgi:Cd2+/Zn2+-exporting ATPase
MSTTTDHSHQFDGYSPHHGHSHVLSAGLLTATEKQSAAFQLLLAMAALCLLALGIGWRWIFPEQSGVGQLMFALASLIVALPVVRSGWHSLFHPSLHGITDQLIALAMLAAWATGDLLTAALLPIIMIFGHVLEERSVVGSKEAMDALARLTSTRARLLTANGDIRDVDNSELRQGNVVEVRAGDRIPADGRILSGQASLDTAPITGESVPADVEAGADVFGGSINLNGLLKIEVTRIGEQSTLGKIIALMQRAEAAKPPITRLLERYAYQYLGLVLTIAAISWFVTYDDQIMLAVLVAACPCALVLSAPATAIAGIAVAARHGILVRSPAFLEELADITSLIIDKTGTLTFGRLRVEQILLTQDVDTDVVSALAASLGAASSHPVSRALVGLVDHNALYDLTDISEVQGLGVIANTSLGAVGVGRAELFVRMSVAVPEVPQHDGPMAGLSIDGIFVAWLLLSDQIKPEAAAAMAQLRELGLNRQLLLTGDRRTVAGRLALDVGIMEVVAEALPEDKLRHVLAETKSGFRPLVVGDGINDALALKAGAVAIGMGTGGADIALASSDIILVGSDLRRLGTCIRLSRKCRQILRTNVMIGLGWTLGVMMLAAFGLLGSAGALVAAILHNVSTLLVLGNSGRLLRYDEP